MKKIDLEKNHEYAGKWSITDFYADSETILREALASGEDFDTNWFGCKKEIHYARITREEGEITVTVSVHMDDLWESDDLIYDALWSACRIEKELPEEIIDSIRDAAIWAGVDDSATCAATIPGSASYEDVVAALDKLETEADEESSHMFRRLEHIVEDHVAYMEETGVSFADGNDEEEDL